MRAGQFFLILMAFGHVVSAAERTVELTITDAAGHPRQYACVGPDFDHLNFNAYSDVDGKYSLKVPTTQPHFVTSYKSGKCALFTVPPDVTHLQVKLLYGIMNISGRVMDASGRGISKATVSLYAARDGQESFLTNDETDAGGYFEDWIPSGDGLTLIARLMKDQKPIASIDPIALHDCQIALELPAITVPDGAVGTPAEKETRRPVGGVVRDEQGKPIAAVKLDMKWEHGSKWGGRVWAVTDAQGRWSRRVPIVADDLKLSLCDDHHVATIFDRGALSPPLEKLLDQSAVSIMKTGQTIRGTVKDDAGNPVDNALVLAASSGSDGGTLEPDEDVATRSRPDGTFQLEGIPAGPRELLVFGRNFAPAIAKVDVQEDKAKNAPLAVTLSAGSDLRGDVVDSGGKAIADVEISVYTWAGENGAWHYLSNNTHTDAGGHFTLPHLPRGTFELRIEKKGYNANFEQDVRLQAEPLKFKLSKPATLAGRIVDDAGGAAVTNFQIVPGWGDDRSGPLFNTEDDDTIKVTNAADGKFSHRVRWSSATTQPIRVIADGFLVKDTAINTTDGVPPAEIRLTRGDDYAGVVVDPQGKPVSDAKVAWVGPGRHAFVKEGTIDEDRYVYRAEIVVKTNSKGDFKLPRVQQKGSIVVMASAGYAQLAGEDFAPDKSTADKSTADKPIRLTAWATVHGSVLSDGKPADRKFINLDPADDPKQDDSPIHWQLYATTGPDGMFRIANVPSIPLRISLSAMNVLSHVQAITPAPGKTVEVNFGVGGQVVRGRIEAPPSIETEHFNTTFEVGRHETTVYARRAGEPIPERFERDTGYAASLQPDGQFVIDAIPPGKYELVAEVHAPVMAQSCGMPIAIGSARAPFEVGDKLLELSTITLEARDLPVAGRPAPALEGKTLAGEPASLAELKGKIVLLDFWASWCAPCKAQTPQVKAIYQKYASDGRLAVLGVDLDYKIEEATRYAESEKLAWPSIIISGWGQNNRILQSFGVSAIPSFWLIDKDGNVLARDIPPEKLDEVVAKAIR